MTWSRDTPWRQGLVLPPDAAVALGLSTNGEACVVVVSHDCDITQDPSVEADVEVVVGEWVARADGNLSYAKNARRLHLSLTGGEQSAIADLRSTGKRGIPKAQLDGLSPHPSVFPKPLERTILQRWLASRYRRSAFPDEFDQRLDATGLRDAMAKALKAHGQLISAVYLDVDNGDQVARLRPEDTYELSIYILFDTAHDPVSAAGCRRDGSLGHPGRL